MHEATCDYALLLHVPKLTNEKAAHLLDPMTNQQTAQKRGQSMVVCIRQAAILQLRLTGCDKIYTAMQCEMVQCNLHVHLKVIHNVTMYFNAGCEKIYTALQCEMVSGQLAADTMQGFHKLPP